MVKENIILERSYAFSIKIVCLVKQFPRNTEGFVIGGQLLKAGTSIGANVEEAIGAFSKQDFTHKMSVALKEARETNYWLRLISDSCIFENIDVKELIDESAAIRKILTSIAVTLSGFRTLTGLIVGG